MQAIFHGYIGSPDHTWSVGKFTPKKEQNDNIKSTQRTFVNMEWSHVVVLVV